MRHILQWVGVSAFVVGGLLPQRGASQTAQMPDTSTAAMVAAGQAMMKALQTPVASTPWSAAQSGWAGRVVVDEWENGLSCELCMLNAPAIYALMRRYPATVFLPLTYHAFYDWFWSDPAEAIDARYWYWYHREVPGLPGFWQMYQRVDGARTVPAAAAESVANDKLPTWVYATVAPKIDAELRRPPEAFFRTQTRVQGGTVRVRVTIDSIKDGHNHGTLGGVLLRLLLVGDTVPLYSKGAVGPVVETLQREQYMVVYAMARAGWHGLGIHIPYKPGSVLEYTFDVAAIQRRILRVRQGDTTYMTDENNAGIPTKKDLLEQVKRFPDDRDWRLNPRHLKVVALVQDEATGEVLQAALVPVDGKRLVLR